jgi:hypothetical protein
VTGWFFLYSEYIIMLSSFLMFCFVKDIITMIVNHKLVLYRMLFLFAPENIFILFLHLGLGFCCSVESMKDRKLEKYSSTYSVVFAAYLFYCISSAELVRITLSTFNIQSFEYLCKDVSLIKVKEKAS